MSEEFTPVSKAVALSAYTEATNLFNAKSGEIVGQEGYGFSDSLTVNLDGHQREVDSLETIEQRLAGMKKKLDEETADTSSEYALIELDSREIIRVLNNVSGRKRKA